MDTNEHDAAQPAYENSPKEVNIKRGMPGGEKQFGRGNKMPQDSKSIRHSKMHKMHHRHKEHR